MLILVTKETLQSISRRSGGLRIVWIPLVPGVEPDFTALDVEVDSSLENGILGSVAVDADPSGGGVLFHPEISIFGRE